MGFCHIFRNCSSAVTIQALSLESHRERPGSVLVVFSSGQSGTSEEVFSFTLVSFPSVSVHEHHTLLFRSSPKTLPNFSSWERPKWKNSLCISFDLTGLSVEKALLNKQKWELKKGFEERIWCVFLCLCYCINTGRVLGLYSL